MADITLTYKGNTIAEISESGTSTLNTQGTYCEDDITLEYVQPSGSSDTSVITKDEWTLATAFTGTMASFYSSDYCDSDYIGVQLFTFPDNTVSKNHASWACIDSRTDVGKMVFRTSTQTVTSASSSYSFMVSSGATITRYSIPDSAFS